jgi:hypothetical protein
MKSIRPATLAATIFLAATAAAASDASVARLVSVSGNVLVTNASSITSANDAARLSPGERVLATANGRAVIEFDAGCRILVEPGQRVEVRAGACAGLEGGATRLAGVPAVK